MFRNHSKAKEPNEILHLIHSSYSVLRLIRYQIPEKMLKKIEKEVEWITKDSIAHNLIDEFTIDEMQCDDSREQYFLDKIIHHKFLKLFNELERQKIIIEMEIIDTIKMLQKAELIKQKRSLEYARKELEQCKYILGIKSNNNKENVDEKLIGGKNYE